MEIRPLQAHEIETRAQQVTTSGAILLLYKNARADMNVLDETFGITGWKREHQIIGENLYCTISIYDKEKQEWVSKQDVGTESNQSKEKGHASDSFKRAGVNLGIGRELYSAPFIWVKLASHEIGTNKAGKPQLDNKVKFFVDEIGYSEHRTINKLVISDQNGKVRYSLGSNKKETKPKTTTESEHNPNLANNTQNKIKNAVEQMTTDGTLKDFYTRSKLTKNKLNEMYVKDPLKLWDVIMENM